MVRSLEGKHPQYYEAILQLRDTLPEVLEFVEEEIARKKIPVAKKIKVKNGSDLYLADNQFTKSLGKKLQERFGGQVLYTSTLHTKKDNKELYRGTVLFRSAPFKKNDVVMYDGEEWVIKVLGKEIMLQNPRSGKKERVKYKDMKNIRRSN